MFDLGEKVVQVGGSWGKEFLREGRNVDNRRCIRVFAKAGLLIVWPAVVVATNE